MMASFTTEIRAPCKPPHLLGGEAVGGAVVSEAGVEEDLVGVDLADSHHHGVVAEQVLQGHLPAQDLTGEGRPRDHLAGRIDSAGAQLGELGEQVLGCHHAELRCALRVDEAKLAPDGEGEGGLGPGLDGIPGGVTTDGRPGSGRITSRSSLSSLITSVRPMRRTGPSLRPSTRKAKDLRFL